MPSAPRPNLFVIGAMKSGTSSLHAYLGTHPAIFMSTPKEPSHFVDVETLDRLAPTLTRWGYWRDETYLALFQTAGDAQVIGESSTNYTKLPYADGVPQRIAAFSPDARFIYLIRDPLYRTISHYWHLVRAQRERRDMLTAFQEDPQYLEFSHYAMQLRPYLETFGPERVKTVLTEELEADPLATLQDLFAWLGVDAAFAPPNLDQRQRVTPRRFDKTRTAPLVQRFHHSKLWASLAPTVAPALKSVAKRYLYLRRPVQVPNSPPPEVIRYLRPLLDPKLHELRNLLQRDFPLWAPHEHHNAP